MSVVSRRNVLKSAVLLATAKSATPQDDPPHAPILAYVGAYTPNGQGIYLFSLNPSTGTLTQVKVASTVPSPSWIAIHPQGRYLYAVNEISNFNGTTNGSVSAFSINRATGDLTFLNVISSQGAGPALAAAAAAAPDSPAAFQGQRPRDLGPAAAPAIGFASDQDLCQTPSPGRTQIVQAGSAGNAMLWHYELQPGSWAWCSASCAFV